MKVKIILISLITVISMEGIIMGYNEAKGDGVAGTLITRGKGAAGQLYNPACLSLSEDNDIFLSYKNPYSAAGLSIMSAGLKYTSGLLSFGVIYDSVRAGILYSDIKVGFNFSSKIEDIFPRGDLFFGAGSVLRINDVNVTEEKEIRYLIPSGGIILSYMANTKLKFKIGGKVLYDKNMSDTKVRVIPELSVKYRGIGSLGVNGNFVEKFYGAGLETRKFFDILILRGGVKLNYVANIVTLSYHSGFSIDFENVSFDFAYIMQPELGGFETVSLQFKL